MTDEFWARISAYVSGSRNYYETLEPNGTYIVCANVYSREVNDYIEHFDGATFDNFEFAYDFWAGWMPSDEEVRKAIVDFHEEGMDTHYEIEVGVWEDGDIVDDCFYNETVRWRTAD